MVVLFWSCCSKVALRRAHYLIRMGLSDQARLVRSCSATEPAHFAPKCTYSSVNVQSMRSWSPVLVVLCVINFMLLVVEGLLYAEVNCVISAMTSNIVNLGARSFYKADDSHGQEMARAFRPECRQVWKVHVLSRQRVQGHDQAQQTPYCYNVGCRRYIAPEQTQPSANHTLMW